MAHRERRIAQLVFQVRPIHAALDAGGVAHRIDLEHLVHVAHRQCHHFLELLGGSIPFTTEDPPHTE